MADLLQLPDALRSWGLDVVEVTGWQDRRRPGSFNPMGVLIHHTAGPKGKDATSLQVCIDGRPDLPGPLCQLLIARSGKVYVISAGRCNHAGKGELPGYVARDQGNTKLLGIELENDGIGEPYPTEQYDAAVRATAAVLDLLGEMRYCVWGHREYSSTGKVDPLFSMTEFRNAVKAYQTPGDTTVPTLPENDPGARIQRALNANGLQPPLKVDGQVGKLTADGLDQVLAWLNGQNADLRNANATSADTIKRLTAERDQARVDLAEATSIGAAAVAQREAAEAEALDLRRQLQTGGRLPQLLADLDAAIAKARA